MGNRAVINIKGREDVGIYLHWNGGPESVLAFLESAKQLGVRSPESDSSYFAAQLTRIIGNFFGEPMSVGVGPTKNLDCDNGDNGLYTVGGHFSIVGRTYSKDRTTSVDELSAACREKYEGMVRRLVEINKPVFTAH